MKKHLIIILLSIVLGGFSGTYVYFQIQKFHVKKEAAKYIKEGINKDQLTLLKFTRYESETKLKWEHSREFEYQNQMYDVVEVEYKNDSVYYWCWLDKDETEIKLHINRIVEFVIPIHSKDKNPVKLKKDSSQSLYCSIYTKQQVFLTQRNLSFLDINYHYSSLHYSPLVPPPKEVFC